MNITVYLGANEGNDPALKTAVEELGSWIGRSGNALVYGGSKSGLMGVLAGSVLSAGGKVTGVEPRFFVEAGYVYDDITRLIVTETMTERKTRMIELGDAFIAFPGGTGTLEEINGYYDGLRPLLLHMTGLGLSSEERQEGICFAENLSHIIRILNNYPKTDN